MPVFDLAGAGPDLICLPGGPGRDPEYLENLGGLDALHRLVIVHPRGAGRSPMPTDPTLLGADRLADDVAEIADHLHLHRVDLLAHSAGAYGAVLCASRNPNLLRRLALVTPTRQLAPDIRDDTDEIFNARADEEWFPAVQRALGEPEPESVSAMLEQAQRIAPAFYGRWDDRQRIHAAGEMRQFCIPALEGNPEPPHVDKAKTLLSSTKVLVITGSSDAAAGVAIGDAVAAMFTDATHTTIDGSGHYPWVDVPTAFTNAVNTFLA
ncbi:MAG: alpha/beta hydrolase [Candidatus Nanopelagicales bacterium]